MVLEQFEGQLRVRCYPRVSAVAVGAVSAVSAVEVEIDLGLMKFFSQSWSPTPDFRWLFSTFSTFFSSLQIIKGSRRVLFSRKKKSTVLTGVDTLATWGGLGLFSCGSRGSFIVFVARLEQGSISSGSVRAVGVVQIDLELIRYFSLPWTFTFPFLQLFGSFRFSFRGCKPSNEFQDQDGVSLCPNKVFHRLGTDRSGLWLRNGRKEGC